MSVHKEISFGTESCQHLGDHGWLFTEGDAAGYVLEEGVPAQRFNGVEVGFAGTQQTDIGLEQAAGSDAARPVMGKRAFESRRTHQFSTS